MHAPGLASFILNDYTELPYFQFFKLLSPLIDTDILLRSRNRFIDSPGARFGSLCAGNPFRDGAFGGRRERFKVPSSCFIFRQLRAGKNHPSRVVFSTLQVYKP